MTTILVVEDNAELAEMIADGLEEAGHSVLLANNGAQARSLLNSEDVDAIVTDFRMPVMDGGELVHHVRKETRLRHLPIVLMSGLPEHASIANEIEVFISKPFRVTRLAAALNDLLYDRPLD